MLVALGVCAVAAIARPAHAEPRAVVDAGLDGFIGEIGADGLGVEAVLGAAVELAPVFAIRGGDDDVGLPLLGEGEELGPFAVAALRN